MLTYSGKLRGTQLCMLTYSGKLRGTQVCMLTYSGKPLRRAREPARRVRAEEGRAPREG